jgi:endoglucanase Acf2
MFTSKEGAYWILFSSEPIVLEYDNIRKTTITASAPFTGVLRLAYIPAEDASDTSTFSSTGLRRLIYHAGVYPTGAQVSWDFPKASQATRGGKLTSSTNATTTKRHATVLFSFDTATMTDDTHRPATSTISLLMLALPHHTQILPMSVQLRQDKRFDLTYSCIKGPMTPIVGSVWTFEEPLYDLEFDAPHQDVDPGVRQAILEQVKDDLDRVLPTKDENVYGFGKQVARLAQLAHITYELRDKNIEDGDEDADSLLEKSKELLFDYLKSFLTSGVVDYLVYDGQMGGLVSHNGLLDKSEDFGNGR